MRVRRTPVIDRGRLYDADTQRASQLQRRLAAASTLASYSDHSQIAPALSLPVLHRHDASRIRLPS
jgi:hypothetical protein